MQTNPLQIPNNGKQPVLLLCFRYVFQDHYAVSNREQTFKYFQVCLKVKKILN